MTSAAYRSTFNRASIALHIQCLSYHCHFQRIESFSKEEKKSLCLRLLMYVDTVVVWIAAQLVLVRINGGSETMPRREQQN